MTMYVPRAAANPARYALPYPRRSSRTTRAPAAVASSALRSSEALSATTTSPSIPAAAIASMAERTQASMFSSSLRHGMTTLTRHSSTGAAITASCVVCSMVLIGPLVPLRQAGYR